SDKDCGRRVLIERQPDRIACLVQPLRNGPVLERAFRLAMTRIVEAQAAISFARRKVRERRRLGASHVGFEARKPDEKGLAGARRIETVSDAAGAPVTVRLYEKLRRSLVHPMLTP